MPAAVLGELHVSSSSVPPRRVFAPRSRAITCDGFAGYVVADPDPKIPF